MIPEAGETVCEHVVLERVAPPGVGVPTLGPVFAGRDLEGDRPLWITVLETDLFPTPLALSRFMAGANELAATRHPSLLQVGLVDREADYCVVGYERPEDGRTLADVILMGPGVPTMADVAQCAVALARSLAFLHRHGRVHGLLSPASCMVWEGAYLSWQHGLAELCDGPALARRCRKAGELVAPELLAGQGPTPAVDVYGWGVTVAQYACLAESAEAIGAVVDGIGDIRLSPALMEVVRAALQSDANARPGDGARLLEQVDAAVQSSSASGASPRPSGAQEPRAAGSWGRWELDDVEEVPEHAVEVSRPPPPPNAWRRSAAPPAPPRPPGEGVPPPVGSRPAPPVAEPDLLQLVDAAADAVGREESQGRGEDDGSQPLLGVEAPAELPAAPPRGSSAGAMAQPTSPPEAYRPPRLPGPHGPPPRWMAVGIVLLTLALPALTVLQPQVRQRVGTLLGAAARPGDETPAPAASATAAAAPMAAAAEGSTASEPPPPTPHGGARNKPVPRAAGTPTTAPPPSSLGPCPDGMVPIGRGSCMDAGEFPGLRRLPKTHVTLAEARGACKARGARLCTEAEWQRACAGPHGRRYPYGARFRQGACNTASVAGYPRELAPSGRHRRCVSDLGLYDLVGNVGEWVAGGVAVGGDRTTEGPVASCRARGTPPPGYAGPDLGFRCCAGRIAR